jgi:hypothetical protein
MQAFKDPQWLKSVDTVLLGLHFFLRRKKMEFIDVCTEGQIPQVSRVQGPKPATFNDDLG